jgi:iron complex outermembrane recepter protein
MIFQGGFFFVTFQISVPGSHNLKCKKFKWRHEMKKSIVLIVFNLLLILSLTAQQKFKINGKLLDKDTKKEISGANITLLNNNKRTISDKQGYFELNDLNSGKYTLKISIIGYEKTMQEVVIDKNDVPGLIYELKEIALPGQSVVVTALRGTEGITPTTFSTYKKEELEKRYTTQDIPVLLSELPSTTFYSESGNGIGYNYINIRGFDQRRISVMINGIPQNEPEDHNVYWLDFPDLAGNLDDIQVQRGGGSAFYGPASIGGSINLITSNFTQKKGISVFAGAGSFNTQKYAVSFSSGLIDNEYSFYGKLSKIKSDGYRDKSWIDYNSYFLGAIRYDENITTQIHLYGGPISDHLAYYGIPKGMTENEDTRKYNPIQRNEEVENFSQPHYELLQEFRIGDNITLNHSIFYIEGEGFFNYDGSWGDTSYFRMTNEFGFNPKQNPENALIKAFVHNRQGGWLPRISWNHESGELTAGLELRMHRSLHYGKVEWASNLSAGIPADFHYYEYKGGKDIFSVYLHELYHLNADMNILADLQYSYNKYKIFDQKFIGTDFSMPYNFVNPKFGINYNINKTLTSYLTISYVSREPKLNNLYDAGAERDGATPQFELKNDGTYDFSKPLVKPENLLNFEIGAGYNCPSFSSTLTFYWMDFNNEIVKSGKLDRFGQPITGNADKTRHIGTEITTQYLILESLKISGNLTYSKNTFIKNKTYIEVDDPWIDVNNPGSHGGFTLVEVSLDGNRISGFPDLLANLNVSYNQHGINSSLIFQYVGKQYTDNFENNIYRPVNDNVVDPYLITNFYLDYNPGSIFEGINITFKFQINNIFDKLYVTHGEGDEFFPAAGRNFFGGIQINL